MVRCGSESTVTSSVCGLTPMVRAEEGRVWWTGCCWCHGCCGHSYGFGDDGGGVASAAGRWRAAVGVGYGGERKRRRAAKSGEKVTIRDRNLAWVGRP